MTEKQQRILEAGLKLFAQEGYANTSTSKVAKAAGVSEGLIFRHFENKEGLLNAILIKGKEMAQKAYAQVILAPTPEDTLRRMLELPFGIGEDQYELWRLIYALKWQTNSYDASSYDPVRLVLKHAFEQMGYEDPEAEVELVFMVLDGAATAMLLHEPPNKEEILKSLKAKYNL